MPPPERLRILLQGVLVVMCSLLGFLDFIEDQEVLYQATKYFDVRPIWV